MSRSRPTASFISATAGSASRARAGRVSRQREPGRREGAVRDDRSERPAAAADRRVCVIPSRIAPRARGFTLIEVLIALVVLAFGMLALARGAGPLGAGGARGAAAHAGDDDRVRDGEPHRQQPEAGGAVRRRLRAGRAGRGLRRARSGRGRRDRPVRMAKPTARSGHVRRRARDRLADRRTRLRDRQRPELYVVAIAWQGVLPTAPADSPCGAAQFGPDTEKTRRVYSTTFQIATLGV